MRRQSKFAIIPSNLPLLGRNAVEDVEIGAGRDEHHGSANVGKVRGWCKMNSERVMTGLRIDRAEKNEVNNSQGVIQHLHFFGGWV
jgi:hypothetical protein